MPALKTQGKAQIKLRLAPENLLKSEKREIF